MREKYARKWGYSSVSCLGPVLALVLSVGLLAALGGAMLAVVMRSAAMLSALMRSAVMLSTALMPSAPAMRDAKLGAKLGAKFGAKFGARLVANLGAKLGLSRSLVT